MRIGIISDTHGIVDAWQKAMTIFGDADLIVHAGDILYHPPRINWTSGYDIPDLADLINECKISLVMARGNCDAEVYDELLDVPVLSPYGFAQIGDLRILVRHGHDIPSDYMETLASKHQVDVFVTGHTHVPVIEKIGDLIHVNPGSPSHPKWKNPNGKVTPTVGLITDDRIQILDLETGEEVMGAPLG
ncbi:MAG: phosphodiesterase [Armatimonadota bacterium]